MSGSYSPVLGGILLVVGALFIIGSGAAVYSNMTQVGGLGVGLGTLYVLHGIDKLEGETDAQ